MSWCITSEQQTSSANLLHEVLDWCSLVRRREAPQQKKKLFDPEASDDVWKHDRFEMLDLLPEEDDYRVRTLISSLCALSPTSPCGHASLYDNTSGLRQLSHVQGFLASGRRGRGRRGGRGSRGGGRPGVNPPPGYENGFAAGPAADSSAQYDDEDGAYTRAAPYAEHTDGQGRGRGGRGRGRTRSAVPINGQQAGDGYGAEVCTSHSLANQHGCCQLQEGTCMPWVHHLDHLWLTSLGS